MIPTCRIFGSKINFSIFAWANPMRGVPPGTSHTGESSKISRVYSSDSPVNMEQFDTNLMGTAGCGK